MRIAFIEYPDRFIEVHALDKDTLTIRKVYKKRTRGYYTVKGNGRVFVRYINDSYHRCKVINVNNGGISHIEQETPYTRDCRLCYLYNLKLLSKL